MERDWKKIIKNRTRGIFKFWTEKWGEEKRISILCQTEGNQHKREIKKNQYEENVRKYIKAKIKINK